MLYQVSGPITEFEYNFNENIKEDKHTAKWFWLFGHLSRTATSGFYGTYRNSQLYISVIDMTRFYSLSPYAFFGRLIMDAKGIMLKGRYRLANKVMVWMIGCSCIMCLAILSTGTLNSFLEYMIGVAISVCCFLMIWGFFTIMRFVVYRLDFYKIEKVLVEKLSCKKVIG
ncbi:MAG: hypothetical protein VB086_09085 [Clostridiaceae bacterium]|nr:hypothetical protein [Clostridiaceae bacterium]